MTVAMPSTRLKEVHPLTIHERIFLEKLGLGKLGSLVNLDYGSLEPVGWHFGESSCGRSAPIEDFTSRWVGLFPWKRQEP